MSVYMKTSENRNESSKYNMLFLIGPVSVFIMHNDSVIILKRQKERHIYARRSFDMMDMSHTQLR